MSERYPVFVEFSHPRGAPPVIEVRSTLLAASRQSLRALGWEERYFAQLPTARHDEIRSLVPGGWVPIALAVEHYGACDRLHLTAEEHARMGEAVSRRTQGTFIETLGKAAGGAGATPWNFLANAHRIWARMMNGGDHCVYKVGPKEAIVVVVGCSLLGIPYFREGLRAYYRTLGERLARTLYANEVSRHCGPTSLGIRLSWV